MKDKTLDYRRLVDPAEHYINGDVYRLPPLSHKPLSPESQRILDRLLARIQEFKKQL